MRISYQYSHLKNLFPKSGDQINEMNTIESLERFATVSYGIPSDFPADISIIRASKQAMYNAKGKKLWMASPYDKEMFEKADLIFTFTDTWTKWLREGEKFALNPKGIAWGDKVVTFPQSIGSHFTPNNTRLINSKAHIGVLGRRSGSTHSKPLMNHLDWFKREFDCTIDITHTSDKSTTLIKRYECTSLGKMSTPVRINGKIRRIEFAGGERSPVKKAAFFVTDDIAIQKAIERRADFGKRIKCIGEDLSTNKIIKEKPFVDYNDMPSVVNACDIIILGQHGPEWEFCGNIKPLEAAACGIPVILERSEAREDTFGKDYPGFVPRGTMASHRVAARNEVRDRIRYFLRGDNAKVKEVLKRVAKRHSIEQTSKVLEGILKKIL